MKIRVLSAGLVAGLVLALAPITTAQESPALRWEGMQKARWKTFDEAWLTPGAAFGAYTKVMVDPGEAAFRKDWQRDYNKVHFDIESRVTDEHPEAILAEARAGLTDAFMRAAREAGYQVVTAPAPDVMRLTPYVTDLDVHAPDVKISAHNEVFAEKAGSARLVLEVRDSVSGALLAGGVDKRDIGDLEFLSRRSSLSNRVDFSLAFRRWANLSFDALAGLGAPRAAAG